MTLLANMYVPSFVQLLTGPLVWSLLVITMVVTVPVIFVISLIEALVVRRFAPGRRLWTLLWQLAMLNAFTSLLGTYFTWPGTNLWPGLALAFVCTVPVEAVFLPGVLGRPEGFRARRYLKVSAVMNVASYAFLAIVLAGLIYLPSLGKEDRALAKNLSGRIAVYTHFGFYTVDLKTDRLIPSRRVSVFNLRPWEFTQMNDGSIYGLSKEDIFESGFYYTWVKDAWQLEYADDLVSRQKEGLVGISPDGHLLLFSTKQSSKVVNRADGKVLHTLPGDLEWSRFSADNRFVLCGKFWFEDLQVVDLETGKATPLPRTPIEDFNPVRPELAWSEDHKTIVIFDCLTGKKRQLTVPGEIASVTSLTWSPDGKYLAYLGDINPFTKQRWTPSLRVVEVAGGKSATVYQGEGIRTVGSDGRPFWLK